MNLDLVIIWKSLTPKRDGKEVLAGLTTRLKIKHHKRGDLKKGTN